MYNYILTKIKKNIMKKYLIIALIMLTTSFYAQATNEVSKLDTVLATVVQKGLTLAEKTGTFVVNQAPELIQEFYQWHMYEDIFYIILGILLIVIELKINYKIANAIDKDDYFQTPIPSVIFLALIGSGMILITTYAYDLIFLYTAPKLYLIEYFIK